MRMRIERSIARLSMSGADTRRNSLDSSLGVGTLVTGRAVKRWRTPGGFAVAGVQDHVPRIGVGADQAGDLAVDAGLLPRLADGRLGDRLAPDQQDLVRVVDHDHVDRRDQAVGR
jgi:hypothetical protein